MKGRSTSTFAGCLHVQTKQSYSKYIHNSSCFPSLHVLSRNTLELSNAADIIRHQNTVTLQQKSVSYINKPHNTITVMHAALLVSTNGLREWSTRDSRRQFSLSLNHCLCSLVWAPHLVAGAGSQQTTLPGCVLVSRKHLNRWSLEAHSGEPGQNYQGSYNWDSNVISTTMNRSNVAIFFVIMSEILPVVYMH